MGLFVGGNAVSPLYMVEWGETIVSSIGWIIGLSLLLLQLAGVAAAGHAVMTNRTTQGTIAWVVVLLTFPSFAVPCYLLFGGSRFRGYVRAHHAKVASLQGVHREYTSRMEPFLVSPEDTPEGFRTIEGLTRTPFTERNSVELLIDGDATFRSIFEGIEEATDYIIVQFFIIRGDSLGLELRERLMHKLKEGVRVYLLFDKIGSRQLSETFLRPLRDAGAHIGAFGAARGIRDSLRLNFRNHRKVVIVDGRAAWVGGHNVGVEYLGRDPHMGPWRDTHARVTGPVVQSIQLVFLEDWYWACGEVPEWNWAPKACAEGEEHPRRVLVVPGGPADDRETIALSFLHAINSAQKRIWIHSPYFVPDEVIVTALQLATLRGVDTRILLPERPDHLLVWLSSISYTGDEKLRKVRFYRYQPGFLHSKLMVVDDSLAVIGTANLDNRSFRINFEMLLAVLDESLTARMAEIMEQDFANAREEETDAYYTRPLWMRVSARTARLMAPIQ